MTRFVALFDHPASVRSRHPESAEATRWLLGRWGVSAVFASLIAGCAPAPVPPGLPPEAEAPPSDAAEPAQATEAEVSVWEAALAGPQRSAENKARDAYRHPQQTLEFFGVTPRSTVVELSAGTGWYTEILGPYLRDEGKLIVTVSDPSGPPSYYGTKNAQMLLGRIEAEPGIFGDVTAVVEPVELTLDGEGNVTQIVHQPLVLAPPQSVDVVLTFRNSHGWYNRGALDMIYGAAYAALRPGGVLGVVQHRAAPGADPKISAKQGYLPEETVIEAAKGAGFMLAERSEVNANPKDSKDHPRGVWTLPPVYRLGDQDRDAYTAIGESDRMTLKFVKPPNP